MSKPIPQINTQSANLTPPGPAATPCHEHRQSPLAELVGAYLRATSMRQIDFCRRTGFDQGLLSKILSSVVYTLNIETALKLAEGMNIPPRVVFEAIGKKDVDEMLRRFYSNADAINQAKPHAR